MIENFLIYSFGKLVKEKNSTVWNWICTASDEFNFFLFFFFLFLFSRAVQVPTGVSYERCELTFRTSLFVVYGTL